MKKIGEQKMERVGIFISNKTQAVRLPKAVALPKTVKQVDIVALGRSRLITPAGEAWDSWFEGEGISSDFMNERDQPEPQNHKSVSHFEAHARANGLILVTNNLREFERVEGLRLENWI